MRSLIKLILVNFFSFLFFSTCISFSQDQEVGEILENIQKAFNHRAKMNGLSSKGEWSEELEKEFVA